MSPESIWLLIESGKRTTSRSGKLSRKAPRNWEHHCDDREDVIGDDVDDHYGDDVDDHHGVDDEKDDWVPKNGRLRKLQRKHCRHQRDALCK